MLASLLLVPDRGPDEQPAPPDGPVLSAARADARPPHLQVHLAGLVLLGGATGTLARWAVGLAVPHVARVPLATFAVNLVGAFVLGALLEDVARRGPDEGRRRALRLTLGTGFCGGFTTFSTFSVEALELLREERLGAALAYALGSVAAGLAAAALAMRAVR